MHTSNQPTDMTGPEWGGRPWHSPAHTTPESFPALLVYMDQPAGVSRSVPVEVGADLRLAEVGASTTVTKMETA